MRTNNYWDSRGGRRVRGQSLLETEAGDSRRVPPPERKGDVRPGWV